MKTIWKFQLEITDNQSVSIPSGYELLAVQTQNETPCLWALVNPKNKEENLKIRIIGTGHPIEKSFNGKYLGTFQVFGGGGIFHVFIMR